MISNDTLIVDIECATFGNITDINKHKMKVFGCYSYKTNQYYYLVGINGIKKMINQHKYIVSFNGIQYDNLVLYNNGCNDIIYKNDYNDCYWKNKIDIDLFRIFKKRATIIKINKGLMSDLLMSYSLDYITKTLDLVNENDGKIKDFDYNLLNKEELTIEEKQTIKFYLERDLKLTKKLYEWIENYFDNFKYFLSNEDIDKKQYLTCSTAVFAYKAICKELQLKEEYNKNIKTIFPYDGAYVAYPAGESFHGNIYCLDYTSLYPSIYHQCNLFSPKKNGWHGGISFKTIGEYENEIQGKIEKLLKKFYEMRLEFKKNKDPREHSIKIIINASYGITGNPLFKHLYNEITASDCTFLARQWILLARKYFRDAGYKNLYSDTDSIYVLDHLNDIQKLNEIKNKIVEFIKNSVPFPYEKFNMNLEDEISDIFFFKNKKISINKTDAFMDEDDIKNKPLKLLKKTYIYITKSGNIIYKNIGKKKNFSALSQKIFKEILLPKIKNEKIIKWDKTFFVKTINELLSKDISLATIRYSVNKFDFYKLSTQLQAQISKKYGSGIHFLIPNKKFGVGIGKKFCTYKEFIENNLLINDIDLTNTWSDLDYFIKEEDIEKNLNQFI